MDIGFAPKEVIAPEVCRLEIWTRQGGNLRPQRYLKLKVWAESTRATVHGLPNRDEDTGQIKQGSKAWSIFEACLGRDFYKRPGVSLNSLIGKQFVGKVTATRTGSRNKVEFGTIGPMLTRP